MMAKKLSNYVVSPLIQKILIALGVTGYVTSLATTLPTFFGIYGGAWRFSSYAYAVCEDALLPVILFGAAYALTPKKAPLLWRVFQGVFLATLGRVLQVAVSQLMQFPIEESFLRFGGEFGGSIWYQVASTLLVIIGYYGIVRLNMRTKAIAGNISLAMQRVFIILTCSAITVIIALLLYRILRQYPSNPNLSGFVTSIIHTVIVPAVLFTAAYFSNWKTKPQTARVFEALLMGVMGMTIAGILSDVATLVKPGFLAQGDYGTWVAYESAIAAIALAIYVVMLWFVRVELKKIKS